MDYLSLYTLGSASTLGSREFISDSTAVILSLASHTQHQRLFSDCNTLTSCLSSLLQIL